MWFLWLDFESNQHSPIWRIVSNKHVVSAAGQVSPAARVVKGQTEGDALLTPEGLLLLAFVPGAHTQGIEYHRGLTGGDAAKDLLLCLPAATIGIHLHGRAQI